MEETINWIDAEKQKPNSDQDIIGMFFNAFVLCFWDAEDDTFRFNTGQSTNGIKYWAEMPAGPSKS